MCTFITCLVHSSAYRYCISFCSFVCDLYRCNIFDTTLPHHLITSGPSLGFTMPISAQLSVEIAHHIGYSPMFRNPLLPSYVENKIIRERTQDRTGWQYVAVQRSNQLVCAAHIVSQSDFSRVQR